MSMDGEGIGEQKPGGWADQKWLLFPLAEFGEARSLLLRLLRL